MKRLFLIVFAALVSLAASAQIAEAWVSMPDSLCPYLSQQQRYYLLQYAKAGQKDSIKNAFDGYSHVDTLDVANGRMDIRMTSNLRWVLSVAKRGNADCLCLCTTVSAPLSMSIWRYYDFAWNLLYVTRSTFLPDPTPADREQHF